MSKGDSEIIMHPTVLWAQRKDYLYITICIGDIKEKKLILKEENLIFNGLSGFPLQKYEVFIDFYGKINIEESKQLSTDREIVMVLKKINSNYWPSLINKKNNFKPHWLKTDFNRWKDEQDDSDIDENELGGGGGGDFSQMMNQMGGFDNGVDIPPSAEEEVDSDDEELPDLKE